MEQPHQLRHTYATQLVNAGCKITTIQALLGHQHLNTTLTYARVHDHTVAEDYYAAMAVVEKRLEGHLKRPSAPRPGDDSSTAQPAADDPIAHLLTLAAALAAEPSTASQQTIVRELQQGLATLAASRQGTRNQVDQAVNGQGQQPQT